MNQEEITALQLAVERRDHQTFLDLTEAHSGVVLSEVQIFGNQTLLMYSCQLGTPEMVEALLAKGVTNYELEWSDNNEIKSCLRNKDHAGAVLPLILEMLPSELCEEMIESDWDPEPHAKSESKSPLEMAQQLESTICHKLLTEKLQAIRS